MTQTSQPSADRRQLAEIYGAQFDYVHRALVRLGARPRDVEDLAHDVFMVVYDKLSTFDASRPIKPWLYGICFRVVSNYRRKSNFWRESTTDREAMFGAPASQDETVEARERRELVQVGLDALDLKFRAVFVMHELEGLSIPEIAAGLSVSHNTLYSRLRLGRARFAEAVRRRVAASEGKAKRAPLVSAKAAGRTA